MLQNNVCFTGVLLYDDTTKCSSRHFNASKKVEKAIMPPDPFFPEL